MFKKVLLIFKISSRAVFDHFWSFFCIFGHISTKVRRNFYFLLHSYKFHMHEPQNQQKNFWDYTFKKVLLIFKVSSRAVFGHFWHFWAYFVDYSHKSSYHMEKLSRLPLHRLRTVKDVCAVSHFIRSNRYLRRG